MQDKDIVAVVVRLRKLETKGREVSNEVNGIRALLREEFDARGTEEIEAGRYRVRRVAYTRDVLDTKQLREQKPKTYAAYCKPQTVSRIEVVG